MDTFIHQSQTPPLTVLSTDQARQGVTGHNVRWVLAWGLYQCSDRRRGDWRSDRSGLAWHAVVTRRVSLLNGDAVMRNYHLNP
jgi:hypothetical protein